VPLFLVLALLFSGCDALKSLYGEIYGEDDGSDGGEVSGRSGGGGSGDNGTRGVSIFFEGVTVDGDGTTTLVSLVFDRDIPGLSENDVTVLDPDGTGAVMGVLSPNGLEGIYTLGIAGVKAAGKITVTVGKGGYTFSPASQLAEVYYDPVATPVTFAYVMPNGVAGSQTTTALMLAFGQAITGLSTNDITLSPGSTGVAMGNLTDTGGGTYTLGLNNVMAAGEVGVTVVKNGWTVSPATISVPVYYDLKPLATGGTTTFVPVEDNPSQIWEIHTFTYNNGEPETLGFINGAPPVPVTAQVLVVAGGGGAGGCNYPSSGAGAGGMVENDNYPLTAADYQVVVGAGGAGGTVSGNVSTGGYMMYGGKKGTDGENSSFGDPDTDGILAYGGGASAGLDNSTTGAGNPGGSSGGGGSPGAVIPGTGGNPYGHTGGSGNSAGGGGAGGSGGSGYGGSGRQNDITGTSVMYAAGGGLAGDYSGGRNGTANTGNGGGGGWNSKGGDGGSGIVVIRFQRPK
jgi:hypothetical protein